jgi:glutathione S-transferase
MPFFPFFSSSPYAINRYLTELNRLYSVLESALEKSEYLAGPTYGIADIKAFGWVRVASRSGIDLESLPKLSAWLKKIEERPAVKEGLAVAHS